VTEPALRRVIGLRGLAAAIFNITVGAAIFVLPAHVAGTLGAAAPLAYLVCAVATALVALCIAEAGSRVPQSGGPYAYVERAFGPYAGYLCGVLLWLGITLAMSAVATVLADALGALVPALGGQLPRAALLIVVFASLAVVNIRGAALGSEVEWRRDGGENRPAHRVRGARPAARPRGESRVGIIPLALASGRIRAAPDVCVLRDGIRAAGER